MPRYGLKNAIFGMALMSLFQVNAAGLGSLLVLSNMPAAAMTPYMDLGGNSGVTAYELGNDYILVEFHGGSLYLYTYDRPGKFDVENMKELAVRGRGLNTYINKYVRKNYARRIR